MISAYETNVMDEWGAMPAPFMGPNIPSTTWSGHSIPGTKGETKGGENLGLKPKYSTAFLPCKYPVVNIK